MWLERSSATVFSPLPAIVALHGPSDGRGDGTEPASWQRRIALQNSSTSQAIGELPLELVVERAMSAFSNERTILQTDKSIVAAAEFAKRVQFLRFTAEIEGLPFSTASFVDLQAFIREIRPKVRPSLFLNDNGNLRALWTNSQHEQIGLQFLGEGNIQYVIFKQRNKSLGMSHNAGVDVKDKVIEYIKASNADGLFAR